MPSRPPGLLSLGQTAPGFRLPEPLTGRYIGPEDFPGALALAVIFLSNRCPEATHIAPALSEFAREYEPRGVQVLGINPMDGDADAVEAPAAVAAEALRRGYVFPYLIDQTQAVAHAHGAKRTPDVFLFDHARRLAYHGRFDETRFGGERPATGRDLRRAADALLSGAPAPDHQVASQGCLIPWREEPELRVSRRKEGFDRPAPGSAP